MRCEAAELFYRSNNSLMKIHLSLPERHFCSEASHAKTIKSSNMIG
tara:strand:- start:570 stop:707 length:138 start_codon:yes stop_codon:yes gene_type:complete